MTIFYRCKRVQTLENRSNKYRNTTLIVLLCDFVEISQLLLKKNPANTDNVRSFRYTIRIHLLNLSCEAVTVKGVMHRWTPQTYPVMSYPAAVGFLARWGPCVPSELPLALRISVCPLLGVLTPPTCRVGLR